MSQKSLVAEEQSYKAISPEKEPERLDITIGKTYMEDEKADMAERKSIPMIWGEMIEQLKPEYRGHMEKR